MKSCKYGEYGSVGHLLFLFSYLSIFSCVPAFVYSFVRSFVDMVTLYVCIYACMNLQVHHKLISFCVMLGTRSKRKNMFRTFEPPQGGSAEQRRSSLKEMRQFCSLPPTSVNMLSVLIQSKVRLPRYPSKVGWSIGCLFGLLRLASISGAHCSPSNPPPPLLHLRQQA